MTWAQRPAFAPGAYPRGDELELVLDFLEPKTIAKTGATSRNTTVTPTADPELTLFLPPAGTWIFDGTLLVTSAANAAGDLMFQFQFPTGATVVSFGAWALSNALASGSQGTMEAAAGSNATTSPTALFVAGASTSLAGIYYRGRIILPASVSGSLTLLWSQFASNANNTTLNVGSDLTCRRVE